MGYCLKTQLKESVDNNTLSHFGFAKMDTKKTGTVQFAIRANENAKIRPLGDSTIAVETGGTLSNNEVTVQPNTYCSVQVSSNTDIMFEFGLKTTITYIEGEYKFANNEVGFSALQGLSSIFDNMPTAQIPKCMPLIQQITGRGIVGDVAALAPCFLLSKFNVDDKVTGKWEELAVGIYENGRNDGELYCNGYGPTFNDVAISPVTFVFSSTTPFITAKNESKEVIGTYNGSTWNYV